MSEANIASMTKLAQANDIKVILASILLFAGFPWRPSLEVTDKIRALNDWMRGYAAAYDVVYADYWTALKGVVRPGRLTYDGVHSTEQGYGAMLLVLEQALKQAAVTSK